MRKALVCGVTFLFFLTACGGGSSSSGGLKFTGNTNPATVDPGNISAFAEGALGAGELGFFGGPIGVVLLEGLFMVARTTEATVIDEIDFTGGCEGQAQGSGTATWSVDELAMTLTVKLKLNDYCNDGSVEGSDGPPTEGDTWNGNASLTLAEDGEDFSFTFDYNNLSIFEPAESVEDYDETEVFDGIIVWDNFFLPEAFPVRVAASTPPSGSEPSILVDMIAKFTDDEGTEEYLIEDFLISEMGLGLFYIEGRVYYDDQGYVDVDTLDYLAIGDGPVDGTFTLTGDDIENPAIFDIYFDLSPYYQLQVWNSAEMQYDFFCYDDTWEQMLSCLL